MALYEIVLRFADREEIRLTDQPLSLNEWLTINGRAWRLIDVHPPATVHALVRFVAEPAESGSAS